ncbi:sugar ABC transporter substrate-binding protein [Paenibacillus wynnii]|uniref:LacI family transcriptional regulator n=1 Tax=Paenibacillus wynnii TaxID=268407 RepID=A0A098M5U1_9BACL|nr:substrate-binding domain-containing protein [Paenibacillus wynnii]KGE17413.1 LacI family transcriptional regulator [Paenibacillus wynnii]
MNVKKRNRLFCLLLTVGMLISGCQSAPSDGDQNLTAQDSNVQKASSQQNDPPRTYGIIYPMVNPTYEVITQNAEEAAKDHNIKLMVQAPDEANLEQQIRIMETMIKQKLNGIAIDPVDAKALIPVINKAVASGIPVVCFESDAPGSNRLSFIGADNYETGVTMGKAVSRLLKGRGMILVEAGMSQMYGLSQRLDGLLHYLDTETTIDVLEVRFNEGSETRATTELEEMIDAHPHFNAFIGLDFVSGSTSTLIWKAKGLKRYALTLGMTPTVKEALRNGQLTSVISQNEDHWGESIIYTLLQANTGKKVPEFVDSGITEIGAGL